MPKKQENPLDSTIEKCRRAAFTYVGLFSFAMNALMLIVPLYSLQVLDRVMTSGSVATLIMLSVVMVGAFTFLSFFQLVRSFILSRLGKWLEDELYPLFISYTLEASALKPGSNSGSQNMRDLSTLRGFVSGYALTTLFDAPFSILFLIVVYIAHPVLGFITLIGAILLLIFAVINEVATREPSGEANEKSIKNLQSIDLATRNAEVIEAMGMLPSLATRWHRQNSEVMELQVVSGNRGSIISSITKFIRLMLQMLITGAGAYLALQNHITMGAIIACSILSGRVLAPFEASIATWGAIISARKAYGRLKHNLMNTPSRRQSLALPKPKGIVEFEKAFYTPSGSNRSIIRGVSFSVGAGDSLGIIGPSASGKSTLAKLLVGVLPPTSGNVRLDSADVYTWNREDFGRSVGYLPQDVELFAGTVKENIARMQPDASDEAIVQAAQIAEVHDMILHLPQGYETEIGIGGASLSAGQRQRIGLARAFFNHPSLLVLDEPNANLDDAGDLALGKAVLNAKGKRITTVIISHRPSLLNYVDYVLVLKDGMVEDFGPAREIFAKFVQRAPSVAPSMQSTKPVKQG